MKFQELQNGLKDAMKSRDTERKEAISTLISAVKKVAIDNGQRDNITDDLVDSVILKELKTAQEQVDTCPKDRTEQLAEYTKKLEVIRSYAPVQMSEDDLTSLISEKYGELIASGNKGIYMKTIMADLKGKADGKLINKVITKIANR
ncbi:MAG: GatB/YqeY domain-containing protein [Oscillospiraceae bacterium]